jgi:hypothetical protein
MKHGENRYKLPDVSRGASVAQDNRTLILETIADWLRICEAGHRYLDEGNCAAAADCLRRADALERRYTVFARILGTREERPALLQ